MDFIISLIFTLYGSTYAQNLIEPSLVNTKDTHQVVYGASIKKNHKKMTAKMKPLKWKFFSPEVQKLFSRSKNNLPFAVKGDFNGDGTEDLALLTKENKAFYLRSFISDRNKYKKIDLFKWTPLEFKSEFMVGGLLVRYLSLVKKSILTYPDKKSRDALQIETYRGPTDFYYYDGNKFVQNKGKVKIRF